MTFKIRFIYTLLLALTLAFIWGCASGKKATTEIQSPESAPSSTPAKGDPAESLPSIQEQEDFLLAELPAVEEGEGREGEKTDPSELLEDGMNSYRAALLAWDQGDLDNAILYLDAAYGLVLDMEEMEISPDSPLDQERNDLRLLIAQRIQEIYASRATAVGGNHGSIPLEVNEHVQRELDSFTKGERKLFEEGYRRSGRFREMILEELRKEGLPEELVWMPMIESWFKTRAFSRASALGLWQFIASTGYRYGLSRDRYIDERMDPEKASHAAALYLKELHSWFGDWTTALASYNCGEFRVRRLINQQRIAYMDNFWDLYQMLPRETRRFVPRFIAAVLIVNDPARYGMDLPEPDPPLRYETISVNKPLKLSTLAEKMGLDGESLADYNPELRHKSTPEKEYALKIPVGTGEQALAGVSTLSRYVPPEATYVTHYVRRGETVSGIATRYRSSISAISQANQLGRNNLIRPGQRLRVPTSYGSTYSTTQTRQLTTEGNNLVYTVKRGDTLYHIAQAFKTSVQEIKNRNNLKSHTLQVGQKLTIHAGNGGGSTTFYTVKSGDSPFKIAQRFGMDLNVLLSLNGLTRRSTIHPGQKLRVTSNR
jgi:membrane-bound lytic murein transglycosylase D